MTHRERFFAILEGRAADRTPFFPDITSWYVLTRIPLGDEQPFFPGQYIPDGIGFHDRQSRLPGGMAGMSFVDFYRQNDWGLPIHLYEWVDEELTGGAEKTVLTEGRHRTVTFHTPKGELRRTYKLDAEGTWSEYNHMVKGLDDLEVVRSLVESTRRVPHPERVEKFLRETAGFGVCDLVIFRSPFGKLIHEYMGFEAVAYALFDNEDAIVDFLSFQERFDLELIEMAARSPGKVVIISDHADENLISPAWYRKYCIPYYRKACDILHRAGKYVSTHLDGNFKSYLPFIKETGFDLLDGCTPAPMFNYEVEELAAATVGADGAPAAGGGVARGVDYPAAGGGVARGTDYPAERPLRCYCGVPASLLTTGTDPRSIADFGERIARAFGGKVIVNVGDILPPNGDIDAVIALGERVKGLRL